MRRESEAEANLRNLIRDERMRLSGRTADDICRMISQGELVTTTGHLLFHTSPEQFSNGLDSILERLSGTWQGSDLPVRTHILAFLVKLSIDLGSYLPTWVLKNCLSEESLEEESAAIHQLLEKLETDSRDARDALMGNLRADTLARIRAEGLEKEAEAEAERLLGTSLVGYVKNVTAELAKSNLMEVAQARRKGNTITELGNDYAVFLQHMIWLGGSFVTTNPVLIKVAWDTDPKRWSDRVDALIRSLYSTKEIEEILRDGGGKLREAITAVNSLVTMSVVEENCRLLRDIFLLTDGNEGYVSLQVNPKNHADADLMVREAKEIYADLLERLKGVPNVVFKLPATSAGMRAAEMLTGEGIGVTITVSFAVFQAVEFAKVLSRGKALVTYIALMNGRMAFPVRDEMKRLGVDNGEAAARWAGVEVARKSYHRLYDSADRGGLGIDPRRVRLLIASLRIYDDWLPDISELWGSPVITFFPNVRRKYDSHSRELEGSSILNETPSEEIETLLESEIFRQAWWLPGDPDAQCPKKTLTLAEADREALVAWEPVANTLNQFVDLYDQMGETVKERMVRLASEGD